MRSWVDPVSADVENRLRCIRVEGIAHTAIYLRPLIPAAIETGRGASIWDEPDSASCVPEAHLHDSLPRENVGRGLRISHIFELNYLPRICEARSPNGLGGHALRRSGPRRADLAATGRNHVRFGDYSQAILRPVQMPRDYSSLGTCGRCGLCGLGRSRPKRCRQQCCADGRTNCTSLRETTPLLVRGDRSMPFPQKVHRQVRSRQENLKFLTKAVDGLGGSRGS